MVHPKARIVAEAGPIVIGEGNLIEEQALIINRCARLQTHMTRLIRSTEICVLSFESSFKNRREGFI